MFAILWIKGYLWLAFFFALFLFLVDVFIWPYMLYEVSRNPPPAPPRPGPSPSRWQQPPVPTAGKPAEEDEGPAGGGQDFREPAPGRAAPRRK
jgi:hypothetical protein